MKTQKRKPGKSGLELDDILDLDEETDEEIEDDEPYEEDDDEEDFPSLMDKKPLYGIAAAGVVILTALIVVFVLHIRNAQREREDAIVLINPAQTVERQDAGKEMDAETAKQESDSQAGESQSQDMASDSQTVQTEISVGALDDEQDPQSSGTAGNEESGAEVTVTKRADETADTTLGIDVSKYQGTINWAKVKASGVDFAMIRVGYRAKSTGEIFEDPTARYNMQEAQAAGVMIGAYFFSSAVTEAEAKE